MPSSFRIEHNSDVPELSPRPIVIRRTGGGYGLDNSHTHRGNYVLVSEKSDGVAASARLCHGSVPVDLISSRNQRQVEEQERANSEYHYQHQQRVLSPSSATTHLRRRADDFSSPTTSSRHQASSSSSAMPPRGSTSMMHFGGSSLLADISLDQDQLYSPSSHQRHCSASSPLSATRRSRMNNSHHDIIRSPPSTSARSSRNRQPTFSGRPIHSVSSFPVNAISNKKPVTTSSSSAPTKQFTTIKTKKTAALTPGALRIIKGQLQNGASVETVVRRTAQAQRDRVYRPRTDRVERDEEDGKTQQLQENLVASLYAAGVPRVEYDEFTEQAPRTKEAKLESYYSPSRRHKNVSSVPYNNTYNNNDDLGETCLHDSKTAIDFDPYALSLLSTLPPLSASTDPFMSSRQELRRPHQMNSCPGAVVMHTALGHLRAVGAAPYLLDCQFGVYATKPKITEQERRQMMEDDLTFGYLSADSDNSDDDDLDGRKSDPLLNLTLSGGKKYYHSQATRRSKLATHPALDDPLSTYNNEDLSPGSAFRKTAMELLTPVPKSDYELPFKRYRPGGGGERKGITEEERRRAQKQKDYKEFNKLNKSEEGLETIDSGITIQVDGRALSDPQARVTRPTFRVFTIFCERHPIPGLKSVCRVPYPRPAPHEWNVTDIIVCFGWRADADIDKSVDDVVGDAFFRNTGLKEHAWEGTLMERRLVFQFFSPPEEDDFYSADPTSSFNNRQGRGTKLSSGDLLRPKGTFHRNGQSFSSSMMFGNHHQNNNNNNTEDDFNFFGGGSSQSQQSRKPDGARHQPFRVHDFEMNSSAEAGYQVFTWESFSKEFTRAIGEAFLRGV